MHNIVDFSLLSLIMLSGPTIARLVYDWYKINVKKEPITKAGYRKRTLATGAAMVVVGLLNSIMYPNVKFMYAVTLSYAIFFLLFDYGLNKARGLRLFYTSSNPSHPSMWEQFRIKFKGTPTELLLKLWVLGVAISLYYFYNNIVDTRGL